MAGRNACWSLLALLVVHVACGQRCRREPPDRNTAKAAGGGGFRIKISGNPSTYTPGKIYTVKLMGWRTQYLSEKFTAFNLVAEHAESGSTSVRQAGSFRLFGYGLAKFDRNCPNMVTHTSTVPKTEAEVLWMAPPPGAGCVIFKAVVVRSRYVWYMDDGGLTRELCEERPQTSTGGTCCACDEARYQLTFNGLWSRESHPRDFPQNVWLTHFSDVLVASHVPSASMWKEGVVASNGLKQVAEYGYTRKLEHELKAQGKAMRSITRAKGLWHPNLQLTTSADFRVDKKRHLVSAVSMIGPSPDWILGISGLDLCLKNCTWMEEKVIPLGLYDAGTDGGITYEAPNEPLSPRQPVRAITASWPDDARSPFHADTTPPLARLTIRRRRVIPRSCDDRVDDDAADGDQHREPEDDRPECMTTPWTDWSGCSVTCGEGLSMRTRRYKVPMKARMFKCRRQLVEKVLCDAPVTCDGRPRPVDESRPSDDDGVCAMTSWTGWSSCSATCGHGVRMRRRNYTDRMGRKKCFHDTEEKEKCMAEQIECEEEQVDSQCPVTDWSEWSPCSVTCGHGQRVKARLLIVPEQMQHKCRHVPLMRKGSCVAERTDCTMTMMEAKKVCMMEKEEGPCRGNFQRWHFEPSKGMCVPFIYGGCRGNRNNFDSPETCQTSCSVVMGPARAPGHPAPTPTAERIDCMATPWSPWSACSASCGRGRQRKTRMVKVRSQNGGLPCPRRLERYRRCRNLPPCN